MLMDVLFSVVDKKRNNLVQNLMLHMANPTSFSVTYTPFKCIFIIVHTLDKYWINREQCYWI